jgi:hypothetical protein
MSCEIKKEVENWFDNNFKTNISFSQKMELYINHIWYWKKNNFRKFWKRKKWIWKNNRIRKKKYLEKVKKDCFVTTGYLKKLKKIYILIQQKN